MIQSKDLPETSAKRAARQAEKAAKDALRSRLKKDFSKLSVAERDELVRLICERLGIF